MTAKTSPSLGVLRTERGLPPGTPEWMLPPGYLANPATFDFPVICETVEGAWVERVFRGDRALEPALIAAAKRLVERGAAAISASCGFFVRYQTALVASVNVPVATSSLLLLPTLLRQLPSRTKIAVLTADSTCLSEDLLGIDDPAERSRVVIGGVEGGAMWQNELKRPPLTTEVSDIEADVVACVTRVQSAHPDVAAVLFECTAFPCVTSTIRRLTRLPVYDVTMLCRLVVASVT